MGWSTRVHTELSTTLASTSWLLEPQSHATPVPLRLHDSALPVVEWKPRSRGQGSQARSLVNLLGSLA